MDAMTKRKAIVELVADTVCNKYGVDINRVFAKDKHKNLSEARSVMVYILHKDYKLPISFIAKEFDRSERWIKQIYSTKKQHILLYDDCNNEYLMFLDLLNI
jgi:chromosomal replication initiation ATPase DnaA